MKKAAAAGATSITVTYQSTCRDGGLDVKDTSGCFTVAGGALTVGGVDIGAPTAVTNKYRTLAGFSTAAGTKMASWPDYIVFKNYFGVDDYANQRVLAGLKGTGICAACDDAAKVQIAKKTSAYMNVWMYAIHEMEDAIADCQAGCINCNDDPVHAWDEGWAFYAGSLEGTDGKSSGKLIHALAEKRCTNYATCTAGDGGADVNEGLLALFTKGKVALQQGKCSEVPALKKRIVEMMSVPLVQGSLRYAYKVGELQGGSKEFAEGAAFSAAILPRIDACDKAAAKTIADNMNMENFATKMKDGFEAVKAAFEKTYTCLGMSCADIGGLVVSGLEYYDKFSPCGEVSKGSCYNARGDHSVDCNVAEADCTGSAYAPGFASKRSGCCHCKGSCPSWKTTPECEEKYYAPAGAAPAPEPEPEPAPAPAPTPADAHDDHDDHDDHDHDTTTAAAPATDGASVHRNPALFLCALALARAALP